MPGEEVSREPVVVTLPVQVDRTSQHRAYGQVHAAFADGAETTVIADLTATTSCDPYFLLRLVAVQRHAASRGGELRLVIPPGSPVRRVAEAMDLDHLLPVFRDLSEAATAVPLPRLDGCEPLEDSHGRHRRSDQR